MVGIFNTQQKLAAMLALIVTNLRQMDVLSSVLAELGARHLDYKAEPKHYPWIHDALMQALENVAGEQWNQATADAWSAAIELIASQMLEGAAQRQRGDAL